MTGLNSELTARPGEVRWAPSVDFHFLHPC